MGKDPPPCTPGGHCPAGASPGYFQPLVSHLEYPHGHALDGPNFFPKFVPTSPTCCTQG